jgi:MFS family permease
MSLSPPPLPTRHWRARLRPALVPAIDGLRMYPRTATMIAALAAAALAVTLPIAWLTLWSDGSPDTALRLESLPASGVHGPGYSPASVIQHGALLFFFRVLGGLAIGALLVALLAALGLGAARASQRSTETTVRRAVGAARRILLAGLALEGAMLAGLALGAGFAGGALTDRLSLSGWPDGAGPGDPAVGGTLALVTGALMIVSLILPVVFARRLALGEPSTRPVPLFVPTIQLGLSLIVLVAGALLSRHAARLLAVDHTATHDGVVYRIGSGAEAPAVLARAYRSLLDRVQSAAGVSLHGPGAIVGAGPTNRITTDCGRCFDGGLQIQFRRVTVTQQLVSADSFHALGVPVVAGRAFTARDSLGAPLVAVVSRSLAQAHFQFGQPIGRRLRIQSGDATAGDANEWYEVVGVVEDRRSDALGGGLQPAMAVYLSILQQPASQAELLLRQDPGATTGPAVDQALRQSLGVDAARFSRTTSAALIARESERLAWFGLRLGLLGWMMLVIASIGTATLMRGWVVSLRPELGLRRAVGATGAQLLRLMLGRAALVGVAGIATGVWFGPALWEALGRAARGLDPWDSAIIGMFAAALFAATIGGVALPAWRATRTPAAELLASAGE